MVALGRDAAQPAGIDDLDNAPVGRAWWRVVRREWRWWAPGTLLTLLVANVLTGGWAHLPRPVTRTPITYDGDPIWFQVLTQRIREGWVGSNQRMGWPFGSNLRDWPRADVALDLCTKIVAWFTSSWVSGFNLVFLASYPLVFLVSYPTNRVLGLRPLRATCAAFVFTFATFHVVRAGHLPFTWYACVPLFHLAAVDLAIDRRGRRGRCSEPDEGRDRSGLRGLLRHDRLWLLLMVGLAWFGIYYALFGALTVCVGALVGCLRCRRPDPLRRGALMIAGLVLGTTAALTPTLWERFRHGTNAGAFHRFVPEADLYAFRLRQLVLPWVDNPVPALRSLGRAFTGVERLEGGSSALGVIATIGLLLLAYRAFRATAGRPVRPLDGLFAAQAVVLFLFGTVGGLGALFSLFATSSIRGWNRISIFLAYPCVVAALGLRQQELSQPRAPGLRTKIGAAALVLVTAAAVYEQNPWHPGLLRSPREMTSFREDQAFVQRIEALLPPRSGVYQMPYSPFPGGPVPGNLGEYTLAYGFLHSKTLRWSWGLMKGRPPASYMEALGRRPIREQVVTARRLGYSAVVLDLRGYSDGGTAALAELTAILGSPSASRGTPERPDAMMFRLPAGEPDLRSASLPTVMARTGVYVDALGERTSASLEEGIDFTQPSTPAFVREVTGLSAPEVWGRWSDGDAVRIRFRADLPVGSIVALDAVPFGPNADGVLVTRLGRQQERRILRAGRTTYRFRVTARGVDTIELDPPSPTSPFALDLGSDFRRLGVGLIRLRVRCGEPCRRIVPARTAVER